MQVTFSGEFSQIIAEIKGFLAGLEPDVSLPNSQDELVDCDSSEEDYDLTYCSSEELEYFDYTLLLVATKKLGGLTLEALLKHNFQKPEHNPADDVHYYFKFYFTFKSHEIPEKLTALFNNSWSFKAQCYENSKRFESIYPSYETTLLEVITGIYGWEWESTATLSQHLSARDFNRIFEELY